MRVVHSLRNAFIPLLICVFTRVPLVFLLEPQLHSTWFVPFLARPLSEMGLDPWSTWIQSGGTPLAFPYSHVMLLVGLPTSLVSLLSVEWSGKVFGLTLLAVDLVVTHTLNRNARSRNASYLWATSPLAIFVTYIHGQTDIVLGASILLLTISISKESWWKAGVWFSIGSMAKLSGLLALPNLVLFAVSNPGYRAVVKRVLLLSLLGLTPLLVYGLAADGYRVMVLGSRESIALLQTSLNLSPEVSFLIIPVVYCLTLIYQLRVGRTTPLGLASLVILSIASVVLTSPSSIGWYLWFLPGLLVITVSSQRLAVFGLYLFQISAVLGETFSHPQASVVFLSKSVIGWTGISNETDSILDTLTFLAGLSTVAAVCRDAVREADPLRLGVTPVVIGIAGDSGVGKSTITAILSRHFSPQSVQIVNGDNYHLFERGAPQWDNMTHLNPAANDLARLQNDLLCLKSRRSIKIREYNHSDGRFYLLGLNNPLDVVIVDGLHALRLPSRARIHDLRVFVSMEEELRIFLKQRRDTEHRGASIHALQNQTARRAIDFERYIKPQQATADIAIHYSSTVSDEHSSRHIVCEVICRNFSFPTTLIRNTLHITKTSVITMRETAPGEVRLEIHADEVTPEELDALGAECLPLSASTSFVANGIAGGTIGYLSLLLMMAIYECRLGVATP